MQITSTASTAHVLGSLLHGAAASSAGPNGRTATVPPAAASDRAEELHLQAQRVAGLAASAAGASRIPLLDGAVAKLAAAAEAFGGAGTFTDAVSNLLRHRCHQGQQQASTNESKVRANLISAKHQQELRLDQLQKKVEAERSSNTWGVLGKIFGAIAAALSAVASVFTGGTLGILAGALIAASMVVSHTVPGQLGFWLGFGLALAGSVVGSGKALLDATAGTFAKLGKTALAEGTRRFAEKAVRPLLGEVGKTLGKLASVGSLQLQLSSASATAFGRFEDARALRAEAKATEAEALADKASSAVQDAREVMRESLDGVKRAMQLALDSLKALNATTQASVR